MARWLRCWWRRTPCQQVVPSTVLGKETRRRTIAALAAAGVAGVILRMVWAGVDALDASHPEAALQIMVTGAISGLGTGVLLYSLLLQALERTGLRCRSDAGDLGTPPVSTAASVGAARCSP